MAGASSLVATVPGKYELWVEGQDDMEFLRQIFNHLGFPRGVPEVKVKGSKDETLQALRVGLAFGSGIERLGIVVDADTDINHCWRQIQPILASNGYAPIPGAPPNGGLVLPHTDKPRLGVWIMPNNNASGAIEDFAKLLVDDKDVLWSLAETAIQQVVATEMRFRPTYRSGLINGWYAVS